jgi:Dioxygenase
MPNLTSMILVSLLAFANLSWAHPGHDIKREATERSEYLKHSKRSLDHCTLELKARDQQAAKLERRQDLADKLRLKRGLGGTPYLKARDVASVLGTSHLSNKTGTSLEKGSKPIFADNSSCILQPDVTEGPYYVSGELIRDHVVEGEEGVSLTLDIQIIDTRTCRPIPRIYLEIWHSNATGVYSGVVANGNGNSNDSSNLSNTALRGVQKTDKHGFVQFHTTFPGHYDGIVNPTPDTAYHANLYRTD